MPLYGQYVIWTDMDGTQNKITTDGHLTSHAAKKAALQIAKEWGWTPPKWWQWWRRNDTKLEYLIEA